MKVAAPMPEPVTGALCNANPVHLSVLSRRDYFAGMALQGLLSNCGEYTGSYGATAADATGYADALIKELDK